MSMILTACFSATGNTLKVAEEIRSLLSAAFFQIKPVQPYTAEDLNWNNPKSRSSVEMKDPACRPAIADRAPDMEQYKTVFIGFPIWWYEAPRIIHTFLDSYDFSGKTCIPFATSGGSGMGKTVDILERACPTAHWLPGKRFPEHPAPDSIAEWIKAEHSWK